jgi:TPP-dependent pyruvate/acetoin dehydrogenase alpha subunit
MTETTQPVAVNRPGSLDPDWAAEVLRRMLRIRLFEQEVAALIPRGEIRGAVHSSAGQEGTEVGACMALATDDQMTGTHRSHGHPIAKGAPMRRLMAELYGASNGVCRGKGGTMHLADFSVGSLGEAAVVAGSVPIAVGAGLASKMQGSGKVCLAFFGDGAANEGVWHESLNLASAWKLPVIFLCENNGFGVSTPIAQVAGEPQIAKRASAYGMPGVTVDGQDVLAVYHAVTKAVTRARAGDGPSLVEAMTYRYDDHALGMSKRLLGTQIPGERDYWLSRDPIRLFEQECRDRAGLTDHDLAGIREGVEAEIADAVEFARSGTPASVDEMWEDMYVDSTPFRRPETFA